ncbi:SDR family NAD(P)-dependent oxidoreductase [Meiothermus ruber]|jgi:NAD(P)-dependent dehydrogenase (short-subunit alcohol dehydrogenase family)|uniref:Short-chain dehydrogenase/reductase SDR n=1 Tax=Meiothermus ruber (strain ATCC 35948 / DSM 1279 / VKM B-1258 / 21) TaxID=504728 RepID=D3PTT3_MEIRD|nr:SDR family NAD(P)-dependent oxidoreductase [Meiothermus ruber]ADD28866.1 short-chain dehydrogenase/reductase SDR [Meiothermus ruber DSM 1279]AGK05685.1 short-chain dehydrogenase/reductase SDR [Meiothermus ruber DSM 1279]MCL6529380.1 SDR family oxidoreductase [Meiothermus ruber]GAO75781.1 short-chain dehydrogenase/reductase SDR [Meiothermus ruber H328]
MKPLAGKHAVVTGGGRGIGAAIATALAGAGVRLTLLGRSRAQLEAQARKLATEVHVETCDVTDPAQVQQAFEGASHALGKVDILVNNAGQAESRPFGKTDLRLWRTMLEVNLTGTFLCTQAALPGMLAAGWGRIVNIASTAGLRGYPYVSAYCAAKHGVIGLTRALALELARKNITVNAVCPGFTQTELLEASLAAIVQKTGRSPTEARAELVRHNPQGRLVEPEEVAQAVLWLCMPGSAALTGQAIAVAGGEVM